MLNKPLRLWHALVALGLVVALAVTGTAVAVQGKSFNAVSTRTVLTAGNYKYVETAAQTNAARQQNNAVAHCPSGGYHVLGGGVGNSGTFNQQHVNDSHPIDGQDANTAPDNGWLVHLDNLSNQEKTFVVFAICAK
jgi:hypothetical protein